jgi:ribosome-binding protein aMBF1 (putative translation factor)
MALILPRLTDEEQQDLQRRLEARLRDHSERYPFIREAIRKRGLSQKKLSIQDSKLRLWFKSPIGPR